MKPDRPHIYRNSLGFWDLQNPPQNTNGPAWWIPEGGQWSYPIERWHAAQSYVWRLNMGDPYL